MHDPITFRSHYWLNFWLVIGFFTLPPSLSMANNDFRSRLHQVTQNQYQNEDIIAERRFGREVAAHILGNQHKYDDPDLTRYVNLVGTALALNAPRSELYYYFAIIDDDSINAYSSPGGYIFITKGAINLAKDEAELAAILAHEIAHVTERHIVRELNIRGREHSGLSGITRLLGGSADTTRAALGQAVDKAMEIIFNTGFKIEDELEADRVATLLLAQTGYDPTALQRYLLRADSANQTSKDKTNRSHPSSDKRHNELTNLIQEEGLGELHYHTAEERFKHYVIAK